MCRYDRVKDSSDFGQVRLGQFRSGLEPWLRKIGNCWLLRPWNLLVLECKEEAATSIIFRVPSETQQTAGE